MIKLIPLNVLHENEITNALYAQHLEQAIGLLTIERNDMTDSLVRYKSYNKRIKNIDSIIRLINLVLIDLRQ